MELFVLTKTPQSLLTNRSAGIRKLLHANKSPQTPPSGPQSPDPVPLQTSLSQPLANSLPLPTAEMSPINGDELRAQIAELSRQVAELQHIVHGRDEQRTPSLSSQRDRRFLVQGLTTVGRGVCLGLVRAGDVADLSDHALKELDDGLKTLALHFVPRGVGAPREGTFGRGADEMIALLNRVSLRPDPMPGVAAEDYFSQFRNPRRGRYLRLGDARQGQFGRIPEVYQPHALYFETFLQLVLFRGIDLDALP